MKSKFILIAFFVFVFLIGIGSAVECNADLSQGGDSCTVSSSLTLNRSYVVNMNGTSTGAIVINAHNIVFDCNNTQIYGNGTINLKGLQDNGKSNVTIQNCFFNNYQVGLRATGNPINVSFINITTNATTSSGIEMTANNSLISNFIGTYATGTNSRGIYIDGNYNLITNSRFDNTNSYDGISLQGNWINITNSYFNTNYTQYAIRGNSGTFQYIGGNTFNNSVVRVRALNSIIEYNQFRDKPYVSGSYLDALDLDSSLSNNSIVRFNNFTNGAVRLFIESPVNVSVLYNYFYNTTGRGAIRISTQQNTLVRNNVFNYSDIGVLIQGDNSWIDNNTFYDSFNGFDIYGVDIYVLGSRYTNSPFVQRFNTTISNNKHYNFDKAGILLRNAINVNISNEYMYVNSTYVSLNRKQGGGNYDATAGIFAQEIFEQYVEVGTQLNDSYAGVSQGYSANVSISNVSINGIPVLLRTQGIQGLSFDNSINNCWFRSFQLPYLLDRDDFYLSCNYNQLIGINQSGSILSQIYQGISNNESLLYSFTNGQYDYYKNIRTDGMAFQVNINNKTSALLTNGTSLCNGSSSNLNLNTGQVNVTLNPSGFCYVLDDYKLIEGSTREYEPFTISGLIVTSALTNTITNVPIQLTSYDCHHFVEVTGYSASCSGDVITITDFPLSFGTNTIPLRMNEDSCQSGFDIIGSAVIMIPLIIILSMLGLLFAYRQGMLSNINIQQFVAISGTIVLFCMILGLGLILISGIGGC